MSKRYEYGVSCKMETYWPTWSSWFAAFRVGRWFLAHWLARDCASLHDIYGCGPHRVVRREAP